MSYSNYRNNMPHYNSMPFSYEPMDYAQGINMGNAPGMPPYGNSMYMQNYFPSMPFMTRSNSPTMPTMPNMPGMPSMPSMPSMPTVPSPGMAPFIPESEMENLPDGDMPALPRDPGMRMPEFSQPGRLPAMPQMPGDGNMYPGTTMPGTSMMPMEMTCEQLLELAKNMNCMEMMHEHMHMEETMPETPAAPTTPRTPTTPTTPTMPTTPRTPTTPTTPTMPTTPRTPTTPTTPTMPTTPRTPTTPTTPTMPTTPTTPTAPTAPGTHNHGISRFYR
nr:hypothetical protein [Sedimentibacter sp.]